MEVQLLSVILWLRLERGLHHIWFMNYEEQVVSLLLGLLVLEGGKVWQL